MGFLNEEQRKLWSDKLMDLANLSIGALVFGSVLAWPAVRWNLIIIGFAAYLVLSFIATRLVE